MSAALRELLAKATPGEWSFVAEGDNGNRGHDMGGFKAGDRWVCTFGDSTQYYPEEGTPPEPQDAALIVAAVNALPALLAQSAAYEALVARLASAPVARVIASLPMTDGSTIRTWLDGSESRSVGARVRLVLEDSDGS